MGRSEAPELPANAIVTATGNNLVGDMARRSLLCQLDPQCERPELRVFAEDPGEIVQANRGRYVMAALTVLRAFEVAGRPKQRDPLGSFNAWSLRVRDALIWLGEADAVDTLETVRGRDPRLDAIVAVVTQWWEVIGSGRVSVQDIIHYATRQTMSSIGSRPDFTHSGFREALLQVAGDGGVINSSRPSKWIGISENRIVEGFRITRLTMFRGS